MILVSGLSIAIAGGLANSGGFFISEEVESEHGISKYTKKEIYCSSSVFYSKLAVLFP